MMSFMLWMVGILILLTPALGTWLVALPRAMLFPCKSFCLASFLLVVTNATNYTSLSLKPRGY